ELADQSLVLVPQAAAAGTRFGGAVLPVEDAPAARSAVGGLTSGIIVETDFLHIAARVVDRHVGGWCVAAAVPAAVVHIVRCGRRAVELQQRHVRAGILGQQRSSAHGLVGRSVL